MTERTFYKLPKCWIGQQIQQPTIKDGKLEIEDVIVTEEMVNPSCHCESMMEAFWCATGHMTECHAGKTCQEANCSHMDRYE